MGTRNEKVCINALIAKKSTKKNQKIIFALSALNSQFIKIEMEGLIKMEEIYLGPTPCGESCAQVGEDNFRQKATKEMNVYINQLYREFTDAERLGIYFKKKWSPHDFGEYGEVVMRWNENDQEADEYAYRIDANIPENWDEEAVRELSNADD